MPETPDCLYNQLANGIHEFIFINPDRAAVDKHFKQLDDIFQRTPPGEPYLVLMDFQRGFPPMNYGFRKAGDFNRRNTGKTGYYAFLYRRNNVLLSVLQAFFKMLPGGNLGGFFPDDEREKAVTWLLNKKL